MYPPLVDGFVAVTDYGWYERLARDPGPRDANFWRPSAGARRLAIGAPFFFKLKAPHSAVAGFSILPDWLAWDTFGEANGVDDLDALRTRLRRIQEGARIEADAGGRIGCCLIAKARFFPRDTWVRPPRDWSPRTQTGATYDLSVGEGRRVWQECLAAAALDAQQLGAPAPAPSAGARYGTPTLHKPRLGQGIFRVKVLDTYGRACAVTGEHSLPVLEDRGPGPEEQDRSVGGAWRTPVGRGRRPRHEAAGAGRWHPREMLSGHSRRGLRPARPRGRSGRGSRRPRPRLGSPCGRSWTTCATRTPTRR